MGNITKIEALGDAINELLEDYVNDVTEVVENEVDNTAKLITKQLKSYSPRGASKKYYKGWTIEKENDNLQFKRTVWNEKHYRRVHLLENGHATANGGRVKAQKHVEPAVKTYGETMPDRIAERIKGGS